ncbi:hypothetical protein CQW23_19099 [Capsicum baccatum]|uniref:Uncharacterized protein n=1 Tax=Capsicum baccatum TaxID=33114 RepID=A0A2G2W4T8_CAPBA|nr:hypothetical protein CQW23_19099 [Capsicum baccatum]
MENLFLYSLDRAATSRVERYAIDQFRHVRANCKRDISVERYIFENANVFSGNFKSYIYPLSDNMARATTLSLLIELCSSERVEPGLPLRLPFDFRYKIGNFTWQINLELVISQPARILEWIDSLKVWTSLSPREEQVEGISMLVGQIEGLFDYDYDSCMVYVPNGKFLSSIVPTDVKYWDRYTGPDLVKEWRKHLDIILPMLVTSIQVTYGAYIMACFVDGKILKTTVLHNEMVVQEIKSNIVLCTNQIHEFGNEYMRLEVGFVLVAGSTWLEVQTFSYSSTAFLIFFRFSIHTFDPGILNIHITDDIDLAMRTHTSIPATYYLIAILGREQLGGLVMEEVGNDAFVNFDKMTKSSAQVFLLSETVMFDIHKSNGPLSIVVKKCILMFFEISENRTEHNNLYEAISKNIQFSILLATNSLALSSVILEHSIMDLVAKLVSGLTRVFGLSMSLSYITVDVVSHMLIYAYTTILVIFTKTKYSFQNITGMQKYVKDPKILHVLMPPIQTALEKSDPTINSDLNSKLHQVFNVCPLVLPSSLSKELNASSGLKSKKKDQCWKLLWIMKLLRNSFGLLTLTKRNITTPWSLYDYTRTLRTRIVISQNDGLRRLPLSKDCGGDDGVLQPTTPVELDGDEEEEGDLISWQAVLMGFGCGLVIGMSIIYIMLSTHYPVWFLRMVVKFEHKIDSIMKRY